MTKKQNARNAKPATEAKAGSYAGAYEWLTGVLSALPGGFEVPQSARELVTRGTASAKERVSAVHDGAHNIVGGVESILVGAVTGIADVNRKLIGAAHEDAAAALAAIDKLAHANSAPEAYQLYVDYWRERGEVGVARARSISTFVNDKLSTGVNAVQQGLGRIVPEWRQAA
jgi:hypothetical protein